MIAGAGLIGASGSASASSPYEITIDHWDEKWIGDSNDDTYPWFRYMVPASDPDTTKQTEFDKAVAAFQELYDQSLSFPGALIQFHEYEYGWFEDYDGNTGWGETSYAAYEPTLDILDDALNSHEPNYLDDATYIWNVKDVHQNETSDWDNGAEHYDIPYTDPAVSSSVYHPTIADDVTGDGHGHDYAHVRVRSPNINSGRMTHGAMVSLSRTRDGGYWYSTDSPPTSVYDQQNEWHFGEAVNVGSNNYATSMHGVPRNNTYLSETDSNGSCGGNLGSSYDTALEFDPSVTYCTSDIIASAINWFHY